MTVHYDAHGIPCGVVTSDPGARSLALTLEFDHPGLRVTISVTGVEFLPDSVLAKLPVKVAGLPTLAIDELGLQVSDDKGPLPVQVATSTSWDDDASHTWQALRATEGAVRISYMARPHDELPVGAHPPLDLRAENGGLSGTGQTFLMLPPIDGTFNVSVRWLIHDASGLSGVCSFGAGDLGPTPMTLERLLDCHFMVGAVSTVKHPTPPLSAHFLTRPTFNVEPFVEHTAQTHNALAATFDELAPEFRVFFRHNPHHRGLSGAALSSSFVAGWNEHTVRSVEDLEAFIDHELVHEWVGLDGPYEEVVWHDEGLADYYGILIPFRAGITSSRSSLARVNLQARLAFASALRYRPLAELRPIYWTDFRAQQEPYYRGFFYFAHLEHALRNRPSPTRLEDLVRRLRDRRRAGETVTVSDWHSIVEAEVGDLAAELLRQVLIGPMQPPPPEIWGEKYECWVEQVPVIDPGFDASTFITGTVAGLDANTPSARAGLRNGDVILDLPRYEDLVKLSPEQTIKVRVAESKGDTVVFRPYTETAAVPQWRPLDSPRACDGNA